MPDWVMPDWGLSIEIKMTVLAEKIGMLDILLCCRVQLTSRFNELVDLKLAEATEPASTGQILSEMAGCSPLNLLRLSADPPSRPTNQQNKSTNPDNELKKERSIPLLNIHVEFSQTLSNFSTATA